MGTDVRITLPADTRFQDVVDVVGLLAGYPRKQEHFKGDFGEQKDSWYVHVEGIKGKPTSLPEMATIEWQWNGEPRMFYYQFEHDKGDGTRLMSSRSRAVNIAVAKGLVDFFGGQVDYNDCDDVDVDYQQPKPRAANNPSDGEEWQRFQEEMWAIQPLTKKEVAQYQKVAAYK